MKTTIELNGFEIVIEESEGLVTVSALKEGETVEEFTLEGEESVSPEDSEEMGDEEMKAFGEEEDDFEEAEEGEDEGEEDEFEEEDDDDDLEEEGEGKLESFNAFIKKRNK